MNEETIKQELQKYNVTDAAITKLNADYMALTVKDVNDATGYGIVKAARIDIKKRRVEVEKTRVQLKAESLEYGRRVDGEAKRITALLTPIEDYLTDQEKIVDDEKARLKAEAEAKEAERIQARIDRLEGMGMGLIAGNYKLPYGADGVAIPVAILKVCTDEQFAQFVEKIQEKKDAEDARLKAEEDAREGEKIRLAQVKAEQERISAEQAKERERLAAEGKVLQDAQDALAREKKATEDAILKAEQDKQRAIEIETAKAEAAEKAAKETAERIQRETEAKDAKEKTEAEFRARMELKAKEAAERKAARQPDKVKIFLIADALDAIQTPNVKTEDGKAVALAVMISIAELVKNIRDKAEEL